MKLRSEAMCTFSRMCISVPPVYQGVLGEGSTTLSPLRAEMGTKRMSESSSLPANSR